ncbi:hypothetical protein DTO013E5_2658 [Penicillium roqueforti]|nr:hypothetical protein DTO012A1_6954 [Penicillium roqueforti]KAI2754560.1 hypothetical protein DTO013F2_1697 [Penicillium roqueforti]KAI3214781.1 hypothetical protein DTO013E5_2658 [Penicillium roqueforti]
MTFVESFAESMNSFCHVESSRTPATTTNLIYDQVSGSIQMCGFSAAEFLSPPKTWSDSYYVLYGLANPPHKINWALDSIELGHLETVRFLVEQENAMINPDDGLDPTPLQRAVSIGSTKIVQYLLANAAKVNHRDAYGRTPLSMALLESKNSIVNVDQYARGRTPFSLAAGKSRVVIMQLLLDYRADPHKEDGDQHTGFWWLLKARLDHGISMPIDLTPQNRMVPRHDLAKSPDSKGKADVFLSSFPGSRLPNGCIPRSEFDIFDLFLKHLKSKWDDVCPVAVAEIYEMRANQLKQRVQASELIDEVAKNTSVRMEIRKCLRSHVGRLKCEIEMDYHLEEKDQRLLVSLITAMEISTVKILDYMEQAVRELVQLELAWISKNEAASIK